MKKTTVKIRSVMQFLRLLGACLLLGFYTNGLNAQDSHTDIIPNGSVLTRLSTYLFIFTEGPVWYGDSVMLFTDVSVTPTKIYRYDPKEHKFTVFLNNSADCNGLTCDRAGNLLACSSKVIMMNKNGQVIKTLVEVYDGKSFNGPNDLIADDKGGVYFTDPAYSLHNQDKAAVYYIDSTGNVTRIIDELSKPNGILLSPDGTRLYVVDSDNKYVYSWDVASDGSISGKSSLAELQTTGGAASAADGMAVDIYGNIYVASDVGIQIFSPQGAPITIIEVPEKPSNCDFGGKDFQTLYVTARKNLYSIELNYPGFAVSRNTSHLGINSIPNKPLVDIYPNPVQNVLNINLPGKTGVLEVYDITGKSLLQKEIRENNPSIDVSGLDNGIYFVKVMSDSQVFTGKIVKH